MSGKASSLGTRLALTEDCRSSVQGPFWKEYARNLEGLEIKAKPGHPNKSMGGQRITPNATRFWRSSVRRIRLRYEDLDGLSTVAGQTTTGHRVRYGQVQKSGGRLPTARLLVA